MQSPRQVGRGHRTAVFAKTAMATCRDWSIILSVGGLIVKIECRSISRCLTVSVFCNCLRVMGSTADRLVAVVTSWHPSSRALHTARLADLTFAVRNEQSEAGQTQWQLSRHSYCIALGFYESPKSDCTDIKAYRWHASITCCLCRYNPTRICTSTITWVGPTAR